MRRSFLHLLSSIGFVHACFWLSAGWAAAEGVACDSIAPEALSLRTFHQAADAYANLLSQPAAASALLVCLQQRNRELAETLMLHQRRLRAPLRSDMEVEGAFLHYVINTNAPKLSAQESADLQRLARTYRQSLLLPAEPDAEAVASCGPLPWTLSGLRCIGQRANRTRYGRDDVVPVHLIEFDASAAGYSTRNATWMSEMSALAYWGADRIGEQLRRWGYARTAEITDRATDTNGFMAVKDNVLVLSFRGTSGFKNFLTDGGIRRVRTDWAAGRVHHGFKSALDAVWLDNFELARHVLSSLERLPEARFESVELTEKKMYLKCVTPAICQEIAPGDVVQAGVVISNSEVGHGTLSVQPLLYRLVCSNGLIALERRSQDPDRAHSRLG